MHYGICLPNMGVDAQTVVSLAQDAEEAGMTPADINELKTYIAEQRSQHTPFDIVLEGETPGDNHEQATAIVQLYAEAGVTWWLESIWRTPETRGGVEGMRNCIKQGPPAKI